MDISELLPYTQLISNIATIIAVIIVVFTFRTYIVNLKKLNFDVVARCVDIYRDKFMDLTKDSCNEERIKRYLDLINEELFYYEQNYLPKIVAVEWMDGIIDLIPIIKNENILNIKSCIGLIHKNKLLVVNPRILQSFTVKKDYDCDLIFSDYKINNSSERKKERAKLIDEILGNVKINVKKKKLIIK